MRRRSLRTWNSAVLASAVVVLALVAVLGIGWLVSLQTRVTSSSLGGTLRRVELRLASGSAVVVGSSSSTVQIRRTDAYAFGHPAQETRSLTAGTLRIASRCPRIVVGSCSASYELAVPETVAVSIQTGAGDIHLTGFRGVASVRTRSGSVDVQAYCGFDLAAASRSGDLRVAAACAPERLSLRTESGDATALVPPGRYRVSATGAPNHERVSGVLHDERAPFTIDAHSGTGAVAVEGGI